MRLDLTVERGELFGFLGPNGAGKTTTIRMALGLILPTGGEVDLLGETVRTDHAPLERVGALVEEPAFWKYLSAGARTSSTSRARAARVRMCARGWARWTRCSRPSGSRPPPASA